MKKEIRMNLQQSSISSEETPVQTFCCPNCRMADTCGANCSQWRGSSDGDGMGRCNVHGGWTDYDKWCCDWYYEH